METEAAQATPLSDYDGDTGDHDPSIADKKPVSVFLIYFCYLKFRTTRKFTRRASKRRCVLFAVVWREPGVIIRRVLFAAGWREPGVVCYHI